MCTKLPLKGSISVLRGRVWSTPKSSHRLTENDLEGLAVCSRLFVTAELFLNMCIFVVIASVQPTHALVATDSLRYIRASLRTAASAICGIPKTDWYAQVVSYIDLPTFRQGPERIKNLYAFRSIVDS